VLQGPLGSHFSLKKESVKISETSGIQQTYFRDGVASKHRIDINMAKIINSPTLVFFHFGPEERSPRCNFTQRL
jgi:hypothetical protein